MLLNTCLTSMTNMFSLVTDKAPNNIVCVCKSRYIDCLIKELGIDNSLDNPTTLTKEEIPAQTIIDLFCFPLEFQPKMKNWIFRHSTAFLNYTSVLTNSAILLDLPNAPRNLFSNYYHLFYQQSKPGFRVIVTLATQGVM